jgi:hypothetical protein
MVIWFPPLLAIETFPPTTTEPLGNAFESAKAEALDRTRTATVKAVLCVRTLLREENSFFTTTPRTLYELYKIYLKIFVKPVLAYGFYEASHIPTYGRVK